MNFYQEVVADYISADRKIFVSPEYYLKLPRGREFWVDAIAIDFSIKACFLCEVTFSQNLGKICSKLYEYDLLKEELKHFFYQQAGIPKDWEVRSWLFINQLAVPKLLKTLKVPCKPKVTYLEYVAPWYYPNGYRSVEPGKPYLDLPLDLQ